MQMSGSFCRHSYPAHRAYNERMGGTNPYISQEAPKPASQKFKITFLPMNVTVEVDPEKIPYGDDGLPGSILDIASGQRYRG